MKLEKYVIVMGKKTERLKSEYPGLIIDLFETFLNRMISFFVDCSTDIRTVSEMIGNFPTPCE